MGDPTPDIQEWVAAAAQQLGLDLAGADQDELITAVLDLTADIAHGVNRPAAPVTAFLVGLAAGGAADPPRPWPATSRPCAISRRCGRRPDARLRGVARRRGPSSQGHAVPLSNAACGDVDSRCEVGLSG